MTSLLSKLMLMVALSCAAWAQVTAGPPPAPAAGSLSASLDRLQNAAQQAEVEISHLRIEKWKTDSGNKQQAQANADSLQRNLTTALPVLITGFRAAPQDLNAGFKLYRNLNALYDVFTSFTETAGAFGPKSDYEALAQQLNTIDSVRRDLGDDLERLTASKEAELQQLRTQLRTAQAAAAAAAATPPKKIVVDNAQPAKKSTHKKKATTTAKPNSEASTTSQPK